MVAPGFCELIFWLLLTRWRSNQLLLSGMGRPHFGFLPQENVLLAAAPEREKLGGLQISHGERFDKSQDQKGLSGEMQKAEGRKRTGESVHRRKRRKRRGLGSSSNADCGSPKREGGLPKLINSERGMRSAGNRSNAECVHRRKRNEGPQP